MRYLSMYIFNQLYRLQNLGRVFNWSTEDTDKGGSFDVADKRRQDPMWLKDGWSPLNQKISDSDLDLCLSGIFRRCIEDEIDG